MKLYVMRHGQTDWNVLEKLQGHTDIELNEVGIQQAKDAKEEFNKCDIDLIICSPLKRTKKTAEIVNEDKKVPIIYDEKIIERGFGDVEGSNPGKDGLFLKHNFWDYNANVKYREVESVSEICDRVWNFLDDIKEKYSDKNLLLVTHGGTAMTINAYFNGLDENGILPRIGMKNCEIREYEL